MAATMPRAVAAADHIMIPHDVFTIILLKLPVESLLRFRFVCKRWNETITSSIFIKEHVNHITLGKTASACTVIYPYSPSDFTMFHATRIKTDCYPAKVITSHSIKGFEDIINSHVKSTDYHISSCNGLLCMAMAPRLGRAISSTFMQVCNPATGKYRDVPRLPLEFDQIYAKVTFLGFGYDPSIDDYKIVYSFKTASSSPNWIVLIFSMKTNTWRSIDSSTSPDLSRVLVVGGFCHNMQASSASGDLYWIVLVTGGTIDDTSVMTLTCNLAEERFELLPFPKQTMAERDHNHSIVHTIICMSKSTLTSYNGSLYILMPQVNSYERLYNKEIQIWKLERRTAGGDGSIWLKVGVIPPFKGGMLCALGFNCSGHGIVKNRMPQSSCVLLYAYLPEENKFELLCEFESDPLVHLVDMETLASP